MIPCASEYILGAKVNVTTLSDASARICEWAARGESRYVCVASVNNVMEAYDSAAFQSVTNQADLVTSDGMPVVWALHLLGRKEASRVYGPDLTPRILERAATQGISVGFYGGSSDTLSKLLEFVHARFPSLRVAYAWSPPFRPLSAEEDQRVVEEMNRSGARIVFVGLNTPKQDYWMARHKGRIQAVTVGVGAAFDFLAGTKRQAPKWMRGIGLEWLFRLSAEPGRLWKRYTKHNARFVCLFFLQTLGWKFSSHDDAPAL